MSVRSLRWVWTLAVFGCDASEPFLRVPVGTAGDPRTDRLCREAADPDAAPDVVRIDCRLHTGRFAPDDATLGPTLTVATYNIERGLEVEAQLAALAAGAVGARADVLLLQEVDRGCSRTGFADIAARYAEALGMDFVFAVEYLELPRPGGAGGVIDAPCEHGNAILSRAPLGNVGAFRHRENVSWYLPPEERTRPGEPRLGGNVAVYGDVELDGRRVHLVSVHFDLDLATELRVQAAQAAETVAHARDHGPLVVVGGDTNAATYSFDLAHGGASDRTVRSFLDAGFVDAHAGLPPSERGTRQGAVIDLVLVEGLEAVRRGICDAAICGALSDHLPAWAELRMAE